MMRFFVVPSYMEHACFSPLLQRNAGLALSVGCALIATVGKFTKGIPEHRQK